ncbi:MAG: AEC family transporter [Sandaracinus sp.]|nr:AEC family transporter [Myxococcales bacterium]MCB9615021.1 AEC family transporter [Sandaracinus sp.]MCB9630771.1 AEC family transporter [Sandaracinus sp.]
MFIAVRVAALLVPLLLGFVSGRARIFAAVDQAISHLNLYALYVAFPALVYVGIADAAFALPTTLGFYTTVPVALLLALLFTRALGKPVAGTVALIVSFGNVAYLGLPLLARVLGEEIVGIASLAVAMHVSLSMLVGPLLLLRWSDAGGEAPMRAVLKQPLTWAPFVGLAARLLPGDVVGATVEILRPLGASAAPVAMFLLGLYLYRHRDALRLDGVALRHVVAKLVVLPAATFGLAFAFHRGGLLETTEAHVLVLLAAMPAAISTFAIAERFGLGERRVCQAVVASTWISAATLPLMVWCVRLVF